MNKKLLAFIGVIALGIGGASAIALQSHAQKATGQSTAANIPIVTTNSPQENTATDTDNIQNDKNGVETPDTAISQDTDKETNDDKAATTEVKQGDSHETGENASTDVNETENGD